MWSLFLVKLQAFSRMQIYQNKKRLQHRFFCEICEGFKNTYFEEHLRTTASKLLFREKPHRLNKRHTGKWDPAPLGGILRWDPRVGP